MDHADVESDDAIVSSIISLWFTMYHMYHIDVILSLMTLVNQCHFYECVEARMCVPMVSYVRSLIVHGT